MDEDYGDLRQEEEEEEGRQGRQGGARVSKSKQAVAGIRVSSLLKESSTNKQKLLQTL